MPDKFTDFLNYNYNGVVNLNIDYNWKFSATPVSWRFRVGHYDGQYAPHQPRHFVGYWIYRTDQNKCWQAINRGGDGLAWWNDDGQATGDPEDWELFSVYQLNPADPTRAISFKNATFDQWWDDTHGGVINPSLGMCCVNYNSSTNLFECKTNLQQSYRFPVLFP